ncbi:uncharacterized protein LOC129975958 [Argiope bruennichi]|uniref:uncharacterized protein LOC129975958 n=1 Tax=Argiope bruennichi TaxID=94029 RepID=UPI002494A8E5|nr:uncharacterized protein LOC129975958 [Argiope bruennichi]
MDRKKKSSNTETSSVISSGVIPIASLPTPELNKKQRTSESACYALGAWNIFRLSVFLACTAILFYQANEFRKRFYTYPTSVNIGKTSFSKRGSFPLPAVTVCFENIASSKLCKLYPHLCGRSEQYSHSCPNEVHYCDVPIRGFHKDSSGDVEEIMINLISNESNTVYFLNQHNKSHFKESFTELDRNRFVTCFSKNLHLYDGEEGTFADNYGVKEDPSPDYLFALHLKILPWELTIDPWHAPRIFFALHSPFEPVNPVHDGVTLSVESDYFMQITRLEEDHLLPYPYRTNCLDYEALWKENNRTGPRSQKICFEQCRAKFFKECAGCESGMTMYETLTSYCRNFTARKCFDQDKKEQFRRRMGSCNLKCKPDCLKLKYYYKTEKFDQNRGSEHRDSEEGQKMDIIFTIDNPDIIILSHTPMFGKEELFSYIGGLMGCWMGISVWSFTGIIGKRCQRIPRLERKLRKATNQSPSFIRGAISFIRAAIISAIWPMDSL